MEKVREAIGDEIEICFDVHTRLDLPDAVYFCDAVKQYRPFFIEDPLRSENIHAFEALRRATAVPIATGEVYHNKWQFRELIEKDLIDYFRADLCLVGGLTEARKIAGWAETHYIKLVPHNPLGPVSTAACGKLAIAGTTKSDRGDAGSTSCLAPNHVPVIAPQMIVNVLITKSRKKGSPGALLSFRRATMASPRNTAP